MRSSFLLSCSLAILSCVISLPERPIRGVNLGGWLITEKWITPSLHEPDTVDEWTLCLALGKNECYKRLSSHWKSFFTYDDFKAIKAVGLNSVRIPVGYWAVDCQDWEPYVTGQFPYLIQAVLWAKALGISVLLDLHGAPGSQNGYDHSGRIGSILFPTNTSNTDRSIKVLRNFTAEFSQEQYGDTVIGVELLNEPRLSDSTFPMSQLQQYYANGASSISKAGFNVTVHDAFWGPKYWSSTDLYSGSSAFLSVDTHQYYAFPPLANLSHNEIPDSVCNVSQLLKSSPDLVPDTVVGEWSLETGELGGQPNASTSWRSKGDSQERRTWFRLLFEAQLAAYEPDGPGQASQGWYYWTWKTEWDIDTWSYRRGVSQGYIPSDVSNKSALVFPVLENRCVDADFNYTAPRYPGSAPREHGVHWMVPSVMAVACVMAMT